MRLPAQNSFKKVPDPPLNQVYKIAIRRTVRIDGQLPNTLHNTVWSVSEEWSVCIEANAEG